MADKLLVTVAGAAAQVKTAGQNFLNFFLGDGQEVPGATDNDRFPYLTRKKERLATEWSKACAALDEALMKSQLHQVNPATIAYFKLSTMIMVPRYVSFLTFMLLQRGESIASVPQDDTNTGKPAAERQGIPERGNGERADVAPLPSTSKSSDPVSNFVSNTLRQSPLPLAYSLRRKSRFKIFPSAA